MPNPVDAPTTLDAQRELLRWSDAFNVERAARFRVARAAGVTPEQIARITGDSEDTVRDLLREPRPVVAPLIRSSI